MSNSKIATVQTVEQLLELMRDAAMPNGNLSIRGVAGLCDVDKNAIILSGDFKSQKIGEILTAHNFRAEDLVTDGFPPAATWLVIEYFAFESKAKAPGAKKLARLFGAIGIQSTQEKLRQVVEPVRQLPPVRDYIEHLEAAEKISRLNDPILKSYLMQAQYEALGAGRALPGSGDRHVPIAVLAREMGCNLNPGDDARLGKWARQNLEPSGQVPHGRYTVNTYPDNQATRDVILGFFR